MFRESSVYVYTCAYVCLFDLNVPFGRECSAVTYSQHFGQIWVSSLVVTLWGKKKAFLPKVVCVYEYKHRHLEDYLIDRMSIGKKIVCFPLEPWPLDLCINKLSARPLLPEVNSVLWIRSQIERWLFIHQIAVPLLHQWTCLSWQWPSFKNKLWLLQECCMFVILQNKDKHMTESHYDQNLKCLFSSP